MFMVPILVLLALGVVAGAVSMVLTDDLAVRTEITVAGALILFAIVMLAWRVAMRVRHSNPDEDARLAWLNEAGAPPANADDAGSVNSWRVLHGAAERRPDESDS